METFTVHTGVAAPLLRDNIDTDAIIPSREMKRVSKQGLGDGLFAGWRYLDGTGRQPEPDFVLNKPEFAGASILLSGPNFGCGSSREHAVWALKEYGIRAVIAPGFGAIFANNCIRNGLLPMVLDEQSIARLSAWVAQNPQGNQLLIDLPEQKVQAGGLEFIFALDAADKHMLIEGLDGIALTQKRWPQIEAFHNDRRASRPWLY